MEIPHYFPNPGLRPALAIPPKPAIHHAYTAEENGTIASFGALKRNAFGSPIPASVTAHLHRYYTGRSATQSQHEATLSCDRLFKCELC
jgi:hypothetical protein